VAGGTLRREVAVDSAMRFHWTLSPDGGHLALARLGQEGVEVLDTTTGKVRCTLAEKPVRPLRLQFLPDSKTLTSIQTEAAGGETFLSLWDPATGKRLRRTPLAASDIYGVVFSPD